MRTTVYIDGFNLFYGCLKGTEYKWLDVYRLCQHIINEQTPNPQSVFIKFYTAPIKSKVASHGKQAEIAQERYHRALLRLYPDNIEIIKGYYSLERHSMIKYQQPPDKSERVDVWRLEEKETDVNIALDMYRDASKGLLDQIVLVSNDTDLVPP